MAVGGFDHGEARAFQQVFRGGFDLLAVLQAACGVIGHRQALGRAFGDRKALQKFGNIQRHGGDFGSVGRAKHMAVVLDRGAAAAGVDHDGIQAPLAFFGHEGGDIGAGGGVAFGLAPHVMGQRAATAHAVWDHHLATQTAQQADGGVVDIGVQRLLRAAGHQGHAHPLRRGGGESFAGHRCG